VGRTWDIAKDRIFVQHWEREDALVVQEEPTLNSSRLINSRETLPLSSTILSIRSTSQHTFTWSTTMSHTPAHQAGVAARKASLARPAAKAARPPQAVKAPKTPKAPKSTQRPALLVDTPEQKALKAITTRVLEALKNPAAIPSNIILAALKEARAV
jgi:hypothetical protein